jgi:hypothetical protein
LRPLGLFPPMIRQMYFWECAVLLGIDEVDDSGPAPTATGLHREPVFAEQPTFRAAPAIESPGVIDVG